MKSTLKVSVALIAMIAVIVFLLWQIHQCTTNNRTSQEQHTAKSWNSSELALTIGITPLGKVDSALQLLLKEEIKLFYKYDTRLLPPLTLPSNAYFPPRNRYKASPILKFLDSVKPSNIYCHVGITGVDISTRVPPYEDWGIFGLGVCPGHVCVISTFRIKRASKTQGQYEERMVKIVLHEIGHNFGLDHCITQGCLMMAANGSIKTVDKEKKALCEKCRKNPLVKNAPAFSND